MLEVAVRDQVAFDVVTPTGVGYLATGGWSTAMLAAQVDAALAATTGTPERILLNIGAIDIGSLPGQAAFEADYAHVVDAFRTKWPAVIVYAAKPWRRGFDANATTLAGWITNVQATRSWLVNGHDEAVWMKGSDDGATMTSDGLHYSSAGNVEVVNQWRALTGF